MTSHRFVMLAAGALVLAASAYSPGSATAQARSAAAMATAANAFAGSLTPDQKTRAMLRFDEADRFNWQESPGPRKGLALRDMTEPQRKLAMELWRTGVGDTGFQTIQMIRSREPVLSAMQQTEQARSLRHPDLYYFSIYGTPSATGTWGWRVEGHHMSLNFTLAKGAISNSPLFLGAQPADLAAAGLKGTAAEAAGRIPGSQNRALVGEEDRARELVQSLDPKQRAVAVFDRPEKRDADMLTGISTRTVKQLSPPGLLARQMTAEQKKLLANLVEVYLTRMPQDVAADRRSKLLSGANLDAIAFSWAGGTERGQAHNYVVQSPLFLIEYAQSRNNLTGHIHTIWRDLENDFGAGLLRAGTN
jgi:Protein of unknown function (DUF3500)